MRKLMEKLGAQDHQWRREKSTFLFQHELNGWERRERRYRGREKV
jgi:hypothetical protein